jgi:hypothetical protein
VRHLLQPVRAHGAQSAFWQDRAGKRLNGNSKFSPARKARQQQEETATQGKSGWQDFP